MLSLASKVSRYWNQVVTHYIDFLVAATTEWDPFDVSINFRDAQAGRDAMGELAGLTASRGDPIFMKGFWVLVVTLLVSASLFIM